MADYWVTTTGTGSNLGTQADPYYTYTLARAALQASGIKGSRIKLINDGSHVITNTQLDITNAALIGTSFSDPGFVVEGVTSSGAPALTTCTNSTTDALRFFQLRAGVKYAIVQGIKFDCTSIGSTTGSILMQMRDNTSGPLRVQYCHIKGYADNTIGTGVRTLVGGNTTGPPDYGDVQYCLLENCLEAVDATLGSTTKKIAVHNCVFSFTGDWLNTNSATIPFGSVPVNAANNVGYYSNTVYIDENGASTVSLTTLASAAGDTGTGNFHSNYMWIETSGAGTVPQVFNGSAGSTATFSGGTIGYNTVYFGPSVVAGDNANKLYVVPLDNGVDPRATDTTAYTTAASTVFNATGSTWDWTDINSSGYTITIPRDLRPLLTLTGGLGGITPGALPAAQTDISVAVGADMLSPDVGDSVTLTVTVTNTGNPAHSVVATAAIPAGLTFVSGVASQGTYVGSTWTIGTMSASQTVTLTIVVTVNSGTAGDDIVFTASYTSSDVTDTNSANNNASLTLSVLEETGDFTDPDGGGVPYLDVLPIFTPVLHRTVNVGLRTRTNRVQSDYMRFDEERVHYREFTQHRMIVATNVTQTVNLGGIQRGKFIMIEADSPVRMSVANQSTIYWPASSLLILSGGEFETVKLNNPSLTAVSTVKITVTD